MMMNQKKVESGGYAGLPAPSWLEIKVLYVRVTSCPLDGIPESLSICISPRSIDKHLEVNGARIPPSEELSLNLRRDRMDTEFVEVTYVTTDHLRAVGSVSFEIHDKDEMLVRGILKKVQQNPADSAGKPSSRTRWRMECICLVGASGCVFTKGRNDYSMGIPAMEISIIGSYAGSPVIMTETVQLVRKRNNPRYRKLHAIPEDEECEHPQSLAQVESEAEDVGDEDRSLGFSKLFLPEGNALGEDHGEMSWFNAGVRVGVGIGLGMCLGVGIGVGLMVRTYQATTSSFRRRLF